MNGTPFNMITCASEREFDALAAEFVDSVLELKPEAAIAFPTGHTPVGMYSELVQRQRDARLDLSRARFFNLDDYVGVPASHPLSYELYMRVHLLTPAAVDEERIRLLQGCRADLEAECADYERAIHRAGGLDLAILGLGANGHIGFNEPGADWRRTTHVVELSEQTRAVHREQTASRFDIPRHGITVGIGTIHAARSVLLLVSGAAKREALDRLRSREADPAWPVTALLQHSYVTVLCAPSVMSSA